MTRKYTQDEIEDYIHGRMKQPEKEALEAHIEADPELAEEVKFFQNLQQASFTLAENDFSQVVKEVDVELAKQAFFQSDNAKAGDQSTNRRLLFQKPRLFFAYAAAILLILAIVTTWQASRQFSNTALAKRYFQYDVPAPVRLPGEAKSALELGQDAFLDENWEKSVQIFSAIPADSPQYIEARFYLAQAYFHESNYLEAIKNLEIVRASADVRYRETADWMLLLSRLASQQQDPSYQTLLRQIADNSQHDFQRQAIELQKDLNRFWRFFVW